MNSLFPIARKWQQAGPLVLPQAMPNPGFIAGLIKPAGGAAPCTNPRDAIAGSDTDVRVIGQYADFKRRAVQFVAGASATICAADARLSSVGDLTGYTATFSIFSDSSNLPNALVGSASSATSVAGVAAWPAVTTLSFASISSTLVNGTTYWSVIEISSTADDTKYLWWLANAAYANKCARYHSGTTVWTADPDHSLIFQLYST